MSPHQIARLIVRLQGFGFLIYTFFDATYLPQYLRTFKLIHVSHDLDVAATQSLALCVLRVAINLLAAVVLLGRTEKCISFLTKNADPQAQSISNKEELKF